MEIIEGTQFAGLSVYNYYYQFIFLPEFNMLHDPQPTAPPSHLLFRICGGLP